MLIKKEKNYIKYLKYFLLITVVILLFVFKNFFINIFLGTYSKIFHKSENLELSTTEREELGQLRAQNKILQDENKAIRDEFSVGALDEKKYPVYMLLGESSMYGDFYSSLPKDRTVYVGMNIFSSGNIVIGTVEKILPNSLKISRLGQNKTFIADSMESQESLELQSLGSGLYFGTVSGGSKISLGDSIVMKGYPKAIVGTVVEITKGNTSLSNVFVRTPYNVNNKEIFYVIE